MARLDLEGLSKVFPGGVVAVRDLTLSVADGELLVLVGPSGCGKTTTLRLIAGLEREDAGRVRIDGRSASGLSAEARDVAMVFPRGALYPHLSVHQNLAWGAALREEKRAWRERVGRWFKPGRRAAAAKRKADRHERVRTVAQQLGLGDLLDRRPNQLSDGQRQRVALGRAMVRRPSVFLMDEPLTGLDAPLRSQLRRELKEWHGSTRATVVYVTHDQGEALLLGDRVAVMNGGRLQQVGSPQEIYETPSTRFVAGFMGSPPMNLIEGTLTDEGRTGSWTFRTATWAVPLPASQSEGLRGQAGHRVVMGIRPEQVRISEQASATGETMGIAGVVRLTESAAGTRWVYVAPSGDAASVKDAAERNRSIVGVLSDCLAIKWSAAEMPSVGQVVQAAFDCRRVHWFDAASGANLTLPPSG